MSKFYGFNITEPLSRLLNTPAFDASILGQLLKASKEKIWIDVVKPPVTEPYVWRITDVRLSDEDGTMSYFRAFGFHGEQLPFTPFGVTWSSCDNRIPFPPDPNYYVPINGFDTVETGGYFVRVLDELYPSERLAFGLVKQEKHQALVVTFRLFAVGAGYPNDYAV